MIIIDAILGILTSPYIWAAAIAYLGGQLLKIILLRGKHHRVTWRDFFMSGNMPSTHSATITALTVCLGMGEGFDSAIFDAMFIIAIIVCYDAMHVRRAAGEQGLVLNELIDRDNRQEQLLSKLTAELDERGDKKVRRTRRLAKPYYSRGHLPNEVLAGVVLGAIVGFAVGLIAFYVF